MSCSTKGTSGVLSFASVTSGAPLEVVRDWFHYTQQRVQDTKCAEPASHTEITEWICGQQNAIARELQRPGISGTQAKRLQRAWESLETRKQSMASNPGTGTPKAELFKSWQCTSNVMSFVAARGICPRCRRFTSSNLEHLCVANAPDSAAPTPTPLSAPALDLRGLDAWDSAPAPTFSLPSHPVGPGPAAPQWNVTTPAPAPAPAPEQAPVQPGPDFSFLFRDSAPDQQGPVFTMAPATSLRVTGSDAPLLAAAPVTVTQTRTMPAMQPAAQEPVPESGFVAPPANPRKKKSRTNPAPGRSRRGQQPTPKRGRKALAVAGTVGGGAAIVALTTGAWAPIALALVPYAGYRAVKGTRNVLRRRREKRAARRTA